MMMLKQSLISIFVDLARCPGARIIHQRLGLGSGPGRCAEAGSLQMRLRAVRGFAGALRRSLLLGRHHLHRVRSRDRVLFFPWAVSFGLTGTFGLLAILVLRAALASDYMKGGLKWV